MTTTEPEPQTQAVPSAAIPHPHPDGPIVAKFGGTSLADAGQIRKTAEIIRSDPRRRFVVVSAPGKRRSDDKKITDLLYLCHTMIEAEVDPATPFGVIRQRYLEIASDLGVDGAVDWLAQIEAQFTGKIDRDWIASRGEYLNARIIAAFLDAEFVDPMEGIRFGAEGRFDPESTYPLLGRRLSAAPAGRICVIPGFYGADARGYVRCFSRGGSDVTGAIVARAVHASIYENWTDVSGLLMADPRIVPNPKPIAEITYREQRELSYMGATVLHDEAVFPVREVGIPIHIRNTNAPDAPGTRIVTRRDSASTAIVGIAGRGGFATIFTEKAMMNQEHGYGRRVLEIIEANGLSYEHSPTSIDTLSVVVKEEELADREETIRSEIMRIAQPDRIEIEHDLAMIAVVGQGMVSRVGMAARVFTALAEAGINIRLINQGSSELNIIVGVAQKDYPAAVAAIYKAFEDEAG